MEIEGGGHPHGSGYALDFLVRKECEWSVCSALPCEMGGVGYALLAVSGAFG